MRDQIDVLLYKNMDVGKLNFKYYLSTAEWLISPLSNKKLDNTAYVLLQESIYGWNAE